MSFIASLLAFSEFHFCAQGAASESNLTSTAPSIFENLQGLASPEADERSRLGFSIMYDALSGILAQLSVILVALAAPPQIILPTCPSAPIVHVQADVRNYISGMATCNGIPNSEALWIAGHECQFGFRTEKYDPKCP